MFHRRKLLMAGLAVLAMPGIAHADSVSQQIDLDSTVAGACGMGNPASDVIDLHDLTGPDGTLANSLTGTGVSGSTVIANAWCNTAHKLSMRATPMALEVVPVYAQPSYMARKITYDATLKNWLPLTDLELRPNGGTDLASLPYGAARAAQSPGLTLEISNLETLNLGGAEQPGLMLEAGDYRGTVTITLATNP